MKTNCACSLCGKLAPYVEYPLATFCGECHEKQEKFFDSITSQRTKKGNLEVPMKKGGKVSNLSDEEILEIAEKHFIGTFDGGYYIDLGETSIHKNNFLSFARALLAKESAAGAVPAEWMRDQMDKASEGVAQRPDWMKEQAHMAGAAPADVKRETLSVEQLEDMIEGVHGCDECGCLKTSVQALIDYGRRVEAAKSGQEEE